MEAETISPSDSTSKVALNLRKWLSKLSKETARKSRGVEEAAKWTLAWSVRSELEAPSTFDNLRPGIMKMLASAGNLIALRTDKELERKLNKHKLGTHARRAALQSYIYRTSHYALPILAYSSPEKYRGAVTRLLTGPIPEFITYGSDFEPFIANSILTVVQRGKKLGLRGFEEIQSKCERILGKSLSTARFFSILDPFIQNYWDEEIVQRVEAVYQDKPLSDTALSDLLLMNISKLPEARIKQWLITNGNKKDEFLSLSGENLLGYARNAGFFGQRDDEPSPQFYLMKAYLKAIRNDPHHRFDLYPLSHLLDSMILTNYLLKSMPDPSSPKP